VIVDDVLYFDEPFFKDGVVTRAVDEVHDQGVVFVSAVNGAGRRSTTLRFATASRPATTSTWARRAPTSIRTQRRRVPDADSAAVREHRWSRWDSRSSPHRRRIRRSAPRPIRSAVYRSEIYPGSPADILARSIFQPRARLIEALRSRIRAPRRSGVAAIGVGAGFDGPTSAG
jgi:hypothetical protein